MSFTRLIRALRGWLEPARPNPGDVEMLNLEDWDHSESFSDNALLDKPGSFSSKPVLDANRESNKDDNKEEQGLLDSSNSRVSTETHASALNSAQLSPSTKQSGLDSRAKPLTSSTSGPADLQPSENKKVVPAFGGDGASDEAAGRKTGVGADVVSRFDPERIRSKNLPTQASSIASSIILSSAVLASAVLASAVLASAVLTSPVPSAVLSSIVLASPVPSAVLSSIVLASPVPSAVPSSAVLASTVPSSAVPSPVIPTSFRCPNSDFISRQVMAWPCNGGDDVPDLEALSIMERLSVYDLLEKDRIPFVSAVDMVKPSDFGVVQISSIVFGLTRKEVVSFLGPDAQWLANHNGACPIHIIMDRSTGKTMDCYVEFTSQNIAAQVVQRLGNAYDTTSAPRMAGRHVEVSLSSQDALLKAIFPMAKCIKWTNGSPIMLEDIPEWSNGFDGFITHEELYCLGRHSDTPYRSVFANRVPQRCYESLISAIWKFPWYATGMYTVHDRNQIFEVLKQMINNLRMATRKDLPTVGLDIRLLRELTWAGVLCPGLNPRQKYNIAYKSELPELEKILDHDWCNYFPFDTLNYADKFALADYQVYAYLMSKGKIDTKSLEKDGYHNGHVNPLVRRLFGRHWFSWNHDATELLLFKDSIEYEQCILRRFVIAGYRGHHKVPRYDYDDEKNESALHDTISDTASVKSSDSQTTVVAIPRATPVVSAPDFPPTPLPAPVIPGAALPDFFDQRTQAAQQTTERENLQSRFQRPLSSPLIRFSVQPSSLSYAQATGTDAQELHSRRNASNPEQPATFPWTKSAENVKDDSSEKSSQATPRPTRLPLNYTDANVQRTPEMRRSGQRDSGEIDPPFNPNTNTHVASVTGNGGFDRQWRFPYADTAVDVPPPSAVPYHRAIPASSI
ncbi:uncharacterized protein N7511_011159 [Penicillium nucicola]|uniref:uncharacterized protein n=1 Tax=Penicillium nucicola TaxID=1850975 RepID=UPI00254542C1|nr:uncharacterized protein N7511_011159 [Penicillium nucicola]KAJ5742758.1 hypothetical protein N7511_011159 [Penicillium nucicola]